MPGPDADGVPPESQEAAAGPISGSSSNAQSTLSAAGSAVVDFGSVELHAASAYASGGDLIYATWCTSASGACTALRGEWADTLTLHSPDATDGTTGSFTVELDVAGSLAAFLPEGWSSYAGTTVRSTWGATVWVDGALRDTLVINCYGALGLACTPSGVRNYYPPAGGYEVIPQPSGFGSFELGPYDFTWGQPFAIDVLITANTAVNRQSNTTGDPSAGTDLTSATLAVLALYDASAGGGNPVLVDTANATAASGSGWFGVPVPEATVGAQMVASVLALAAIRRCRRRDPERGRAGATAAEAA
ncbi:MAG: hypothetical protein OZ948_15785 [Deltaproteobacteria bacterium]|nr:hypothetical protein [Deltaproteobacteria bacterium]